MAEFDERNYVPEEYLDFKAEPSSGSYHKHARVSGGIYESHPEIFEQQGKSFPEIVKVNAPSEVDAILNEKGNAVAIFSDILEHDDIELVRVSKYPEPDKFEIRVKGLGPVGATNNPELDLEKLKSSLAN